MAVFDMLFYEIEFIADGGEQIGVFSESWFVFILLYAHECNDFWEEILIIFKIGTSIFLSD